MIFLVALFPDPETADMLKRRSFVCLLLAPTCLLSVWLWSRQGGEDEAHRELQVQRRVPVSESLPLTPAPERELGGLSDPEGEPFLLEEEPEAPQLQIPEGRFSDDNSARVAAIEAGRPFRLKVAGKERRFLFRPHRITAEDFRLSMGVDTQMPAEFRVYEGREILGMQLGEAASLALVNDKLAMAYEDESGKYMVSENEDGIMVAERLRAGMNQPGHDPLTCQEDHEHGVSVMLDPNFHGKRVQIPVEILGLEHDDLSGTGAPTQGDNWVDHNFFRLGPAYDASLVDLTELWVSAKSQTGSSSNLSTRAAQYFTFFARHADTYERQLGFRTLLQELILIPDDSAEEDPGPTGTSSDLSTWGTWLNNHRPHGSYDWGHAALWMVVDGSGGGVIGRAYLDSYGGTFGRSVNERNYDWDVYNHEMGHNVGASHTSGGVMNSSLSNNNEDFFRERESNAGYTGAMDIYNYMASSSTAGNHMYGPASLRHPEEIPFALDDAVSTAQDTPVVINPLSNDNPSVMFGAVNSLTVEEVGSVFPASAGSAVATPTSIQFTPAPGYSGQVWFTYTIRGDQGNGGEGWLHAADVVVTVGGDSSSPSLNPSMQLQDDYVVTDFSSDIRVNPLLNDIAVGRFAVGDVDALNAEGGTAQSYSQDSFHLTGASIIQGNGSLTLESRIVSNNGSTDTDYSGYLVYTPGGGDSDVIIEYSVMDGNNASGSARIYMNGGSAPVITAQPSGTALLGDDAYFLSVTASGNPQPQYQWRLDGIDIPGAQGPGYTIASATASDAGSYTVLVSNSEGSVLSTPAVITVNDHPSIVRVTPLDDSISIPSGVGLALETAVSDDGFGGSSLSQAWTVETAPPSGVVNWDQQDQPTTAVTFSEEGTYVLRITASDGVQNNSIDFTVKVGGSGVQGYTESGGLLVIEAEDFDQSVEVGGQSWSQSTSVGGYSGSGLVTASPNNGTNINAGYTNGGSPRLDYQSSFSTTGTYYIWIRGSSGSGSDDSAHVSLNDQVISTADRIAVGNGGNTGWAWKRSTMDNANASLTVPSAGEHTLNLYMREDGASVDRILLTTDNSYTPSGSGPAVSPRGSQLGPVVDAGASVQGNAGDMVSLDASVSDDGNPGGGVTTYWEQVSGPDTLSFGDANSVDTSVSGSTLGSYVLRLYADDGEIKTFDSTDLTLLDLTGPGALQIESASYSVTEADGSVTVQVRRVGGINGSVSVTYNSNDVSALAGSDYTSQSNTLTWGDQEGGLKSIVLSILDDAQQEASESFSVDLSSPTGGATLGAIQSTSITILDDDDPTGLPNMVLWYPFDSDEGNTASDAFIADTESNDLTVSGASWTSNGYLGGGLSFSGATDLGSVGNSTQINDGSFAKRSIGLWFKASNIMNRQLLFEEGGSTRGLNLYLDGGKLYVGGWNNGENGWTSTFLSTEIEVNTWHHVVLVLDAAEGDSTLQTSAFRGYLDGTLFAEGDASTLNGHTGAIGLGAINSFTVFHDATAPESGNVFAGELDEVVLYNSALTAAQVTQLAGGPIAAGSLVATVQSSTEVGLSWSDLSANETGFLVQRSASNSGPWTDLITTAANVTGYTDSSRSPGSTMYYRVLAVIGNTGSAPSNVEEASTYSEEEQYYVDSGLAYNVDPAGDSDGDGLNDGDEFEAGTNPNDISDVFDVQSSPAPAGVRLQRDTVSGKRYAIEFRASLTTGSWAEIQFVISDGSPLDATLTDEGFYRIVVSNP